MKTVEVKDVSTFELASKEAALTLLKDGVVVYPTDTVYGLGVNALDKPSVERLFRIKKRSSSKPIPLMVSSIEMAKALAFIDSGREAILKQLWPGPFTFVLWKKKIVLPQISAGKETVALRIPAHQLCQSILRDFEGPITGTSANISGEESFLNAQDLIKRFSRESEKPDIVVSAGKLPESAASAVIDLTGDTPKILRVNPTSKERLLDVLKILS